MKIRFLFFLFGLSILLIGCIGRGETAVFPTPATPATLPTPDILPPTLFPVAWQDRSPFAAGLIAEARPVLDTLPQFPVYHLVFTLNDTLTAVDGQMQLYYTNLENKTLDVLYFHLFPNLLGGKIEVTKTQENGQPVTAVLQSEQNSILKIPLKKPLQPSQSTIISLHFSTQIPLTTGRNYGVFANVNDILALAHFYPQIAVFDEHEGWNIAPPAPAGDVVYADTAFYLVQVTAPKEATIVTSGIETARTETAETHTLTIVAGPMRDFYLAASPRFIRHTKTLNQTTIHSYAPPELEDGAKAALTTAATSLNIFNTRFQTPYPYTEFDIVTTATTALGIEYPGIIALTENIYNLNTSYIPGLPNTILLESTTVHEVAHQWFYGLVGNDQLDEPWLDESLTQYATLLYYQDRYGTDGAQGFRSSLENRWARTNYANIPIGLPVSAYADNEYGAIVYGRGPLFFERLAEVIGEDTFDRFLQQYIRQFAWQTATTDTLKQLAESNCGCDLTPLFREWVFPHESELPDS